MSSQQEIREYIKHRRNDPWYREALRSKKYQHYPDDYVQALSIKTDYEVVRKLYDIFTYGDELYMYTRYDIMDEEIQTFIDSFIDDFEEKYSIISKYLKPYQIKILSF